MTKEPKRKSLKENCKQPRSQESKYNSSMNPSTPNPHSPYQQQQQRQTEPTANILYNNSIHTLTVPNMTQLYKDCKEVRVQKENQKKTHQSTFLEENSRISFLEEDNNELS
uniref:Uncharacterized protein n=1 Tax=Glossina austeni TaxID=7395 RepID=A0A1A9VNK9_GLOAU